MIKYMQRNHGESVINQFRKKNLYKEPIITNKTRVRIRSMMYEKKRERIINNAKK